MRVESSLKKIKPFTRKKFGTQGLVLEFIGIEDNKSYPRTFNLSKSLNEKTQIIKFLRCLGIKKTFNDSKELIKFLDSEMLDKQFSLTLEPSGREDYPWNIVAANVL